MTDRLKRICDEIRELDREEQAFVLNLLGDLGEMPEADVERVWMLEARRRARFLADEAAEAEAATSAQSQASREAVNAMMKRKPVKPAKS